MLIQLNFRSFRKATIFISETTEYYDETSRGCLFAKHFFVELKQTELICILLFHSCIRIISNRILACKSSAFSLSPPELAWKDRNKEHWRCCSSFVRWFKAFWIFRTQIYLSIISAFLVVKAWEVAKKRKEWWNTEFRIKFQMRVSQALGLAYQWHDYDSF